MAAAVDRIVLLLPDREHDVHLRPHEGLRQGIVLRPPQVSKEMLFVGSFGGKFFFIVERVLRNPLLFMAEILLTWAGYIYETR